MSLSLDQVLFRGVDQILPGRDSLRALMQERSLRVFLGIDPTGSLLTLGHSIGLRKLQQFADLGHEAILLIGNGTVRIGDPTGRDSTRPVLTDEVIRANFEHWKEQASKVLDFSKIKIVYNGDWLDKLTFTDLVKLMAKTTVQQLIERDMFQDRIAKGLPIFGHEIMYPLLQGYDSVELDVDLEIGGTDQTFNMMMGRHLQEEYNGHQKWVLSTPIINGTDGRKMSKSFGNFVALTEQPTDMYGKLMRITDDMIIEYFTVLTDVSDDEIAAIKQAIDAGANPMEYKKKLAHLITEMYHSVESADLAAEHFQQVVQDSGIPEHIDNVTITNTPVTILDALSVCIPSESRSQLRRLIEQGGVELIDRNQKITDPTTELDISTPLVIRAGKRRFFRLKQAS